MTTKQKTGLIIFWLGVIIALGMGGVVSYFVNAAYHLTIYEAKQSIWAAPKPLFMMWAIGVPIGAILVGLGAMLYKDVKQKTIWWYSLGTFFGFAFIMYINGPLRHNAIFFGVTGTLMTILYFCIIWRMRLDSKQAIFRIIAYTFLMIGMWFTCEVASRPYLTAREGVGESPINIMLYFLLAFVFFRLSEQNKALK